MTPSENGESERDPEELLPLSAVDFTTLLVLLDGDSYGYAIVQDVRERTGGRIDLLPGNFYNVLQRLLRDGLIEPSDEPPPGTAPGKPRRMFRITPFGEEVVRAEATALTRMADHPTVRRLAEEAEAGS